MSMNQDIPSLRWITPESQSSNQQQVDQVQDDDLDIPSLKFITPKSAEPEESQLKSIARTVMQVPKVAGYISAGVPNALLEMNKLIGDVEPDIEEMAMARRLRPELMTRNLEKEAQQGIKKAKRTAPSLSSAYEQIEKQTGIPLEAKTPIQKGMEVASWAANPIQLSQGLANMVSKGGTAAMFYTTLKKIGVPDFLSELISIGGAQMAKRTAEKPIESPEYKIEKPIAQPPKPPVELEPSSTKNIEVLPEFELGKRGIEFAERGREIEESQPRIGKRELPFYKEEKPTKEISSVSKEGTEIPIARKSINQLGTVHERLNEKTSTPVQRSLNTISKYTQPDKRVGGERVSDIFSDVQRKKHDEVNHLYDQSDKLLERTSIERPKFFDKLTGLIEEANGMEEYKADGQAMRMAKDLRDSLIEKNKPIIKLKYAKEKTKFRNVSNKDLANQAKEFRQYIQARYPFDKSNVFYKYINAIEDEILETSQHDPKAYTSYLKAKNANRDWNINYNNSAIRPYVDKERYKFTQLYDNLSNPDEYNKLSPILREGGVAGQHYDKILRREIIAKEIQPIIEKGGSQEELSKALDSLNIKISPEERSSLMRAARIQEIGLKGKGKLVVGKTSTEKRSFPKAPVSIFEGKTPEQVGRELQTVSAIRELESKLSADPSQLEKFQQFKKELGVNRIYNGKVKSGKIKNIANILENVEDLHYLEETLGKDIVEEWKTNIKNYETYIEDEKKYNQLIKDLEKKEKIADTAARKEAAKKAKEMTKKKLVKVIALKTAAHGLMSYIGSPTMVNQIIIDTVERKMNK